MYYILEHLQQIAWFFLLITLVLIVISILTVLRLIFKDREFYISFNSGNKEDFNEKIDPIMRPFLYSVWVTVLIALIFSIWGIIVGRDFSVSVLQTIISLGLFFGLLRIAFGRAEKGE